MDRTLRLPANGVECRWCSDGGCLLCQMTDSITLVEETGGVSSPAGRLDRVVDLTPGPDLESTDIGASNAPRCALCGVRYKEMAMHYRHAHPGVQYVSKRKKGNR